MMNQHAHPEQNLEDQRLFDLLVDGELDDTRRKQLLQELDHKPEGWRQCALAFLEAQSWRGSLNAFAAERPLPELPAAPDLQSRPELTLAAASGRAGDADDSVETLVLRPSTWTWVAVAASMIVAITLGVVLRNSFRAGPMQQSVQFGDEFAQVKPAPPQPNPIPGIADSYGYNVPSRAELTSSKDNVQLVVDGDGGGQRTVDVPLIDNPTFLRGIPFPAESAIPAEMLRQLEQLGHRVEHQRRLAPVQLRDGSRVLVPVEDLHIVPIGRQAY